MKYVGNPLHILRGDRHEDVELTIRSRDVVVDHRGVSQVCGFLLVRGPADDVIARELILGALQLMLAHRFRLEPLQFLDQRGLGLSRRSAGLNKGDRKKEVRMLDDVALPERGHRHLLLVDEPSMDPRALTVGQNFRRDMQGIGIRMFRRM